MKSKVRSLKSKVVWSRWLSVPARLVLLVLFVAVSARAQQNNELSRIPDGRAPEKWLFSNAFPAETDAGAWENFNRFNIETLPAKNWLAPFGGPAGIRPQPGTTKAPTASQPTDDPKSKIQNPKSDGPLPEIGAQSNAKTFADATEIVWTAVAEPDATLDFHGHFGGKTIGTAYAAAYIAAAADETRYLETDGFLGKIWLNGAEIYDGFSLNVKRVVPAQFRRGTNILLVRASGISGDYWRKNGGWTADVRIWRTEDAAVRAATFQPSGAAGTIFYLEGFHVDPVYLHDQRGYARITLSNTAQYLRNLRADRQYGVYLSEIDYLKPYLDTHAEDRQFLREKVREGRVGAGGAYNQFNENTIGGEAIIRNILYGQEMHQAILGRRSESLALWDVFGHAPQISQIARKAGFSGIVWSKKIQGFQPFFFDYALDGSRLLHRRVDYAYSFSGFGSGKNYSFDNFRRMTERKFAETQSFGSAVDLRINAADFTPPWTNLAGNVRELEAQKPQVRVTGQAQDLYFQALNKELDAKKLRAPVTSRDKLFFHVGVGMARSDLKIGQRASENMTLTAEKFGSIAYLLGAKYPDRALDKAWRHIFFGSHHDAITGTPSDNALLDLVYGYREAFELSKGALDDSLKFIAKQIDTNPQSQIANRKSQIPVVVFNPMNWTRTDKVRARLVLPENTFDYEIHDAKGARVDFVRIDEEVAAERGSVSRATVELTARDVPSLGYKTFFVAPLAKSVSTKPAGKSAAVIENEYYRVTVDPQRGGAIASIFDKQARREIVNAREAVLANQIGVLKEELTRKNVIYPAWELWTTGEKRFSTEKAARVTMTQNGGRQSLTIEGELPNMRRFVQTIALDRGVRRIDFRTELVDYTGRDELFVVNFPLNLSGGALVTEDRFGTVVRNSSKGFLDFRTNTDKLVSGAPVYSVNNWAGYGSTFDLRFLDAKSAVAASVPFKPLALVRPHGENFEDLTEALVAALIRRGVSATPFYDDLEAERRKNLPIEDSTMPKNLNDDAAYHNFRLAVGTEKENQYSARLLKQVAPATRAGFEARLQRDGHAFLFLYDKETAKDFPPMPALLIAADGPENYRKAVERITLPIRSGASTLQPSFFKNDAARRDYENLDTFAVELPLDAFAVETNPEKELPRVPDYGVALVNRGTAGVSLEKGNVLTLFLTHTALWPGVNLPFEFTPEHKSHAFEYSLYPHAGNWREADAVKVGYDVNHPLVAVQTDAHAGQLPAEKSFFRTGRESVVVPALKLGENPQASFRAQTETEAARYPTPDLRGSRLRPLVLRAYETEGRAAAPALQSDFKIEHGAEVDLLERPAGAGVAFAGQSVGTSGFDAFEIKTFQLFVKRAATADEILGAQTEPVQPVFARYWMHNAGVAPLGNDAVKVSLRPVEQMGELSSYSYDDKYNQGGTTTVAVRVSVVNNYQDRRVSGEVRLEVPEDWRVVPASLKYDIEPNGSFTEDVAVLTFPVKKDLAFERASGLVKARIEHDSQTFEDVLNLGKPLNLSWTVERAAEAVRVVIKNPHRQAIAGAIALVTPPEAWYFAAPAQPREQGFTAPARGETVLTFPLDQSLERGWAIARLAYNGQVEYLRADDYPTVPVKK